MQETLQANRRRLAKSVRQLRESRGWTQPALAARAGTTPKQVHRVEGEQANVTMDILGGIAAAFEMTLAELVSHIPAPASATRTYTVTQAELDRLSDMFDQLNEAFEIVRRLQRSGRRARRLSRK